MRTARFRWPAFIVVTASLIAAIAAPSATSAQSEFRPATSPGVMKPPPVTPKSVAADLLIFANVTLTSAAWKSLGDYSYLNAAMGYVQNHARTVLATDEQDLVSVSAKGAILLNAVEDAASTAEGIVLRPRTAPADKQALTQLAMALRANAAALGAVILPLPAVKSVNVSTPQRRVAIAALDLAQTARADQAFLAPGRHPTLSAGLETLERAAQSVLLGSDADDAAALARLTALSTAIQGAARVAAGIDRRANENPQNQRKAADLSAALRMVGGQLTLVMQSPQERAY
jgi:hypothetical protein